jgi:hypothetical protein
VEDVVVSTSSSKVSSWVLARFVVTAMSMFLMREQLSCVLNLQAPPLFQPPNYLMFVARVRPERLLAAGD